jgi:oligopeptide transport system permease protein
MTSEIIKNNETAAGNQPVKGTSLWKDAWRRLLKNRMAVAGGALLILIACAAILAPALTPYAFDEIHLSDGNRPPSRDYPLGTDHLGRDLLTRILYGGRVSLAVGVVATFVSIIIGVSYGATAGYLGGRADNIMMRFVDILYGLPFMFLVILMMVIFHNAPAEKKLYLLFIGLGAVQWLTMSRITRGQTLSIKTKEYIMAARTSGAGAFRIVSRHVIPNLLGPVIVYATLTVPAVMLEEAFLSFLGLGVQAPMASWGSLASDGRQSLDTYPWQMIFPGLALAITLFSLNFLGDGLRDALDPQMKDQK